MPKNFYQFEGISKVPIKSRDLFEDIQRKKIDQSLSMGIGAVLAQEIPHKYIVFHYLELIIHKTNFGILSEAKTETGPTRIQP